MSVFKRMKTLQRQFLVAAVTLLLAATGCASPAKDQYPGGQGVSRAGYSVQVGAFREVRNAEKLAARLQEKGLESYYFRKEDGVYAVRFGDFRSREEARLTAARLHKENILTSYFIASPKDPVLKKGYQTEVRKGGEQVRAKKNSSSANDMGNVAARTAERFVGIPYRWGGDTVVDGMDCSGFVRAVYNLCGVNIPRTSREQFRVGESVSRDDLKDGDLVFFGDSEDRINHVGIFVGQQKFVHAPRRGDDIKFSSLEDSYFTKRFIGGKRYF